MHQSGTLRALEGLEAKRQRLAYLKEQMPALVPEGKLSLFVSCMYTLQAGLKTLQGQEKETLRRGVGEILAELRPLSLSRAYSWKDNLWILMAKVSFEGTCRLRNLIFERE